MTSLYDETDCLPHVKPAPLSGWQPIETVPKDGTRVDLWSKEGFRICGCKPEVYDLRKFSHWMPLPAPPVADAVLREAGE